MKRRQAELLLQILQQIDDLRLDGDVERGNRLVEHEELRIRGQRARDTDALSLSAGEFVGVSFAVVGAESDRLEELRDARVAIAR